MFIIKNPITIYQDMNKFVWLNIMYKYNSRNNGNDFNKFTIEILYNSL